MKWDGQSGQEIHEFPLISVEALRYLKNILNLKYFMTNAPSFDEETSVTLENHNMMLSEVHESVIIVQIDATNLHSGLYMVEIGV